jgi:hypothetical protein
MRATDSHAVHAVSEQGRLQPAPSSSAEGESRIEKIKRFVTELSNLTIVVSAFVARASRVFFAQ